MASFSAATKQELCTVPVTKTCCAVAEAYGLMLFASQFSEMEIRIVTSLEELAGRIPPLLIKAFGVPVGAPELGRGGRMTFRLTEPTQLERIFGALGYDCSRSVSCHLHQNIVEEDCCRASFLRGAFLASGTVASPDKKTHLEMATPHRILSREVMSLMLDMAMQPKMGTRKSLALLYFKDTECVEDFLTLIGAPKAAMAMMQGKVEKQLRNHVNRAVNCETANLIKASNAAAKQIVVIRQALEKYGWDVFPEATQETVRLRLDNPDSSLSELAAKFDPPISKPGLSHRLRRVVEIANTAVSQTKEENV